MFTLNSIHGGASFNVERDYDGDVKIIPSGGIVYLDDASTRDLARKLLAFVGDEADDAAEVKVGDRVEITKLRTYDHGYVGRQGCVTDVDDDDIPYRIALDNGGAVWAMEVRKVAPAAPATRAALLDEARRLAGTGATPADVLAYAKFLSE